jgi:hypothetical protein
MANEHRTSPCRYCGHNEPHFGTAGEFNCRFGPPRVWDADPAKRTNFACPCKQYAPTPAEEAHAP